MWISRKRYEKLIDSLRVSVEMTGNLLRERDELRAQLAKALQGNETLDAQKAKDERDIIQCKYGINW